MPVQTYNRPSFSSSCTSCTGVNTCGVKAPPMLRHRSITMGQETPRTYANTAHLYYPSRSLLSSDACHVCGLCFSVCKHQLCGLDEFPHPQPFSPCEASAPQATATSALDRSILRSSDRALQSKSLYDEREFHYKKKDGKR